MQPIAVSPSPRTLSSKTRRKTLLLALPLALLACAQQPAPRALAPQAPEPEARVTDDGLTPRQSRLDNLAAAFAFDLSGARVYMPPVQVDYARRSPTARATGSRLRRDHELRERDLQRLQELMVQTVNERFLAPRNSQLVDDARNADYTLQLRLESFALSAPLDPPPELWRVYTEQSAWGTLAGDLYDREGNLVMRFSDRRDIGESFGGIGPGGRLERFTSVSFWADMRQDLRRAFASLDRDLR